MAKVAAPWRTATLGQSTSAGGPPEALLFAGELDDFPNPNQPPSLSVMDSSASADGERHEALQRAGHQPAARERLTDPVAEAPGLRDAAPDIGKRQPADQRVVRFAEQKKCIRTIGALVLRIAAQAPPEGRAG